MNRSVLIHIARRADGGLFFATCPERPSLLATGDTVAKVLADAARCWRALDEVNGEDGGPTALDDIAFERQRQIKHERHTSLVDDDHHQGEMASAAAAYAYASTLSADDLKAHADALYGEKRGLSSIIARLWAWEPQWFKCHPPRRAMVIAGALCVAEIERIDRAEADGVA